MKTLLSLSLLAAFAGTASATQFMTMSFGTGNGTGAPNVGQTFTTLNDTYTASFTNFVLTSSDPYLDVQWTHSFDTSVATANSPATSPYFSVTQTVTGTVSRSATAGSGAVSFGTILSETVMNANGAAVGTASRDFTFSGTSAGPNDLIPFTYTLTVPFTPALASGFAVKDDLFFNASAGTVVRVNSISQRYTPVPEPATIAGLALGGLVLLRRRKR